MLCADGVLFPARVRAVKAAKTPRGRNATMQERDGSRLLVRTGGGRKGCRVTKEGKGATQRETATHANTTTKQSHAARNWEIQRKAKQASHATIKPKPNKRKHANNHATINLPRLPLSPALLYYRRRRFRCHCHPSHVV